MKTDNEFRYNFDFLKPGMYATTNESEDLAPPLTLEEAAKRARKFINTIPNDMIDGDLGNDL